MLPLANLIRRVTRAVCPAVRTRAPLVAARRGGFTIVEVACAVTILALFGVGAMEALFSLNRNASSTRALAAAREIVQRNMETAMTVPFSTSSIPAILATTTGTGWNETADVTTSTIPLLVARDGTVIVSGSLRRTVTVLTASTYHPSTRRVTFSLSYVLNGRTRPDYVLTSIRSPDK